MFGKMMNRFYYGKSGKGDYTREDLPETRWQLFWEMLRVRFTALFKLNIMYMVAWLPAIIVIGRSLMLGFSGLANLSEMQLQMEAGEIAAEMVRDTTLQYQAAMQGVLMQTLLLLAPAIAITGPFTAGAAYVTRNWARDEHSFIWSDFWDAVKGNWKQGLLTSIITGVMPLFMYVSWTVYGNMAKTMPVCYVAQVLCIMIGLLWMMSLMYTYPQMITYDLKYPALIRNSLIMLIGRLPMTAGLKLLSAVPAVLCAAVSLLTPYAMYAMLVYGLYYVLLGFALSRFVGASYANAVFDHYINVKIEGAEVGRGLQQMSDDDEEDDEAFEA